MVEGVKQLASELQILPFTEDEALLQRDVPVVNARIIGYALVGCSKGAECRVHKAVRVEPLETIFCGIPDVAARNKVGALRPGARSRIVISAHSNRRTRGKLRDPADRPAASDRIGHPTQLVPHPLAEGKVVRPGADAAQGWNVIRTSPPVVIVLVVGVASVTINQAVARGEVFRPSQVGHEGETSPVPVFDAKRSRLILA